MVYSDPGLVFVVTSVAVAVIMTAGICLLVQCRKPSNAEVLGDAAFALAMDSVADAIKKR